MRSGNNNIDIWNETDLYEKILERDLKVTLHFVHPTTVYFI